MFELQNISSVTPSQTDYWKDEEISGALSPNEENSATASVEAYINPVSASDPSIFNPTQPMPPYNPSAPNQMFNPYDMYGSGNDVLSKTYLMLDWMVDNPSNTNGAEFFLLYLSSLCTGQKINSCIANVWF